MKKFDTNKKKRNNEKVSGTYRMFLWIRPILFKQQQQQEHYWIVDIVIITYFYESILADRLLEGKVIITRHYIVPTYWIVSLNFI